MHFENETIIITDPCYFIKNEFWDSGWYEDCDFESLGIKGIATDTIYGDWSCTTYDTDTCKKIGNFCADAGMVAVASLKDVLKHNPQFDNDIKKDWVVTVIENFTGDVNFKYDVDEDDYDYVYVEGRGNINFKTSQSGF